MIKANYINDLLKILSSYPEIKRIPNLNIFHLNWDDSAIFLTLLYRIIEFDKNNKEKGIIVPYDLFGVMMIIREVGIGLYQDKRFGFVIKPFIGINPDNSHGWNSLAEYNVYKEYLLPYAPWIARQLKEISSELV